MPTIEEFLDISTLQSPISNVQTPIANLQSVIFIRILISI